MAIEYVSSVAGGGNSISLPTHQADDLLLLYAWHDGSGSAPVTPVGWTEIFSVQSGNQYGVAVGYKIASSASETSGTWTNAAGIVCHIYRGIDTSDPIGDFAHSGGAMNVVKYPALTMEVTDGSSWVVGFCSVASNDSGGPPTGMVQRVGADIPGGDDIEGHDTDGGVSSWSQQDVAIPGGVSRMTGFTVEILAGESSGNSVLPDDATHSHSAEAPTITQDHQVTPGDALHGHSADSPAITQTHSITPDSCVHAHTSESPALTLQGTVEPEETFHAHTTESPSITQDHQVDPSDALHGHSAGSPTVAHIHHVNPTDALHAHLAEAPSVIQGHQVAPGDALHSHSAESPTVSQKHSVSPLDSLHSHVAGSPTVSATVIEVPSPYRPRRTSLLHSRFRRPSLNHSTYRRPSQHN